MLHDKNLPNGWSRSVVQRLAGKSAGKYDKDGIVCLVTLKIGGEIIKKSGICFLLLFLTF
jgi:hypothetical protein